MFLLYCINFNSFIQHSCVVNSVCFISFYKVCLLVFCCFFVFCGRAKKVVREGPIFGGLKRVPQVEEALDRQQHGMKKKQSSIIF